MACYTRTTAVSSHQFTSSVPTALFPTANNKPHLISRHREFSEAASVTCRVYRRQFIQSRLVKLIMSCKLVEGEVIDAVSQAEGILSYDACKDDVFSYQRVPSIYRNCVVNDMKCLPENPNSFKTVGRVLDKIIEHVTGGRDRHYIPVYMDGAPFGICMKLLRDQYICGTCGADISSDKTDDHLKTNHKDVSTVEWTRKYKKILIRPGSGHIEMTSVKAILNAFWVPFVKPIARIMGYNSESQLQYCMKGYDHHKAYNLLMVILAALSDELLYSYVRDELLHNRKPSYENYCAWAKQTEERNILYILASDFCFTTLHSLNLFRCAVRNCNDEVALHARHKLTSLLYVCNNYKYQKILCYDTCYLLSLEKAARERIIDESSRSENGDMGEGYDFLLENRSKLYKSFLPSDSAPSFDQWLHVTTSAKELEEIREVASERLELNLKQSLQRPKKFEEEIMEARKLIRRHGLLLRSVHGLTSLTDENVHLDDCFQNYILKAESNCKLYYDAYLSNERIHLPVLNTGVEINLDSCNDEQLTESLQRKIASLKEPLYSFFKKSYKKSLTKHEKIVIFKAVVAQLQCQQDADYEAMLSDAFHEHISIYN